MKVDDPKEPLRPVVSDDSAFDAMLDELRNATGPVPFDVERAHGYRYWPKAYLFQIRREGAGTFLIDPTKFSNEQHAKIVEATDGAEWILHAASQDLPSMFEAGIVPPKIYDTEIAARILSKPGASLGALLESELGIELRKAHSAVNWAQRPLKESWLKYAALDVDYLVELRDAIDPQLTEMGRKEWAQQEFEWELQQYARATEPREEPWRRLSRITSIRSPRGLALARELWEERERIAQRRDRPPTHILPDKAIVELATKVTKSHWPSQQQMFSLPGFATPPGSHQGKRWLAALNRASKIAEKDYPSRYPAHTGKHPQPRQWEKHRPDAAARWFAARSAIDDMACEIGIQASLLAPPAALQDVLWEHTQPSEQDLLDAGMRPWQADLLIGLLDEVLPS